MKYALFGDIHGEELNDLGKFLDSEDVDVMICTGDFDQVRSIHQFIELEKKFLKEGKKVAVVPGNHDYAIYCGHGIKSGTIRRQGKDWKELHKELRDDPIASRYVKDLFEKKRPGFDGNRIQVVLDRKTLGESYRTMIVHGAPVGDMSSYKNCPKEIQNLWARLTTEDDYGKVFDGMEKHGYRMMIRGHDHDAVYSSRGKSGIISIDRPSEDIVGYRLSKEKRHIVNPGALFEGSLATIDTNFPGEKVPVLKYHEL